MAKLMVMAGGTGGHVFPGIAVAEALKAQSVQTCWLGTQGGMEQTWVSQANIPFNQITIKGLRGNGLKGWLMAPFNVLKATWQALKIMRQEQPDLVLGMGGFVCGPGGVAAKLLGIPLVLHEQNAIPGMTNKWLAHIANQVITAFPQDKIKGPNVVQIGNPVRAGLEEIEILSPQKPLHLLVVGGSRGALALNEWVPKALACLPLPNRPVVLHQTGQKTLSEAQAFYQTAGVEAKVVPFIEDMVQAYQQADLVVCRAGALTISELMAAARPAILVPYPYAVDDHQTANAQALVNIGGGELYPQSQLTAKGLAEKLHDWLQANKLKCASQAIRDQSPKAVTQQILKVLMPYLS